MILYHIADLDGHCSGAVVKKFSTLPLYPFNYGYEVPKLQPITYMVDCSVPDMLSLNTELIWIDHHQHEQNKLPIKGIRRIGVAACELCCEYFNWPVPEAVKLLGAYDVWNLNEEVLHLQYGMRQYNTDPRYFDWEPIFNGNIKEIMAQGKIIYNYQKERDARLNIYEDTFMGYKALMCNSQYCNSLSFNQASLTYQEKYGTIPELLVAYYRKGDYMMYSLYTYGDVDCSALAKQRGGGGHKKAAGYREAISKR